jgi:Nucleotide modification associated domain 2
MYVVDRDFGFAPNPFHGYCTLATCKPVIRKKAGVGDWVIGMGGARLKATGRCIFAMRVNERLTFNDYWDSPRFLDKRPIRNGSLKMIVGDNIYHFDTGAKKWNQADSHHSNADGSVNRDNLARDTQSNIVLVSQHFFYFGKQAPAFPGNLLDAIGYKNVRSHRVFDYADAAGLVEWLTISFSKVLNEVTCDPFDFDDSQKRYSAGTNKIT